MLAAIEYVNYVSINYDATAEAVLGLLQPDVYVKGGDYDDSSLNPKDLDVLSGINCVRKFVPFEINISTSKIIKQCN